MSDTHRTKMFSMLFLIFILLDFVVQCVCAYVRIEIRFFSAALNAHTAAVCSVRLMQPTERSFEEGHRKKTKTEMNKWMECIIMKVFWRRPHQCNDKRTHLGPIEFEDADDCNDDWKLNTNDVIIAHRSFFFAAPSQKHTHALIPPIQSTLFFNITFA